MKLSKGRRRPFALAGTALALALMALAWTAGQAAPAHADRELRAYVEVQFGPPVQTFRAPDPNSGPAANLPSGYIVNGVGKVVGVDRQIWVQLESPDGRPLGWLPLPAFIAAAGLAPYTYGFWYYRFPYVPIMYP